MAVAESITRSSFGCPTIEIPKSFTSSRGRISFEIMAEGEIIKIESFKNSFVCRASRSALMAAGLVRHEWMPGFGSNNKRTQLVAFPPHGSTVIYGNQRGGHIPHQFIQVKGSPSNMTVIVSATPEQIMLIKECEHSFWENHARARLIRPEDELQSNKDEAQALVEEEKSLRYKYFQEMNPAQIRDRVVSFLIGQIDWSIDRGLESILDECRFKVTEEAKKQLRKQSLSALDVMQQQQSYRLKSSALAIVR